MKALIATNTNIEVIFANGTFFAARSKTSGDERSMVVEHMVIHPNFTDYKDDLGNILQTAYSGSYLHPNKQNHEPTTTSSAEAASPCPFQSGSTLPPSPNHG